MLKNYTTYETYYKIAKRIEDDPSYDKKKASRAIARFLSLHPHNLAQKTEVMIEHFRRVTRHKIDGKAKAMLVTSSRLHAVRYKLEFEKYIKENKYDDLKVLVAFSGTVKDDFGGINCDYTEAGMNGFGESELPEKFDSDEYQILLVAEKYQTGFDQPLLHTMYVDKKLSGLKAVQTLSRLNRVYEGKFDTFILDFVNDPSEIKNAFQQYYEEAVIDETTDPNILYDIKYKLDNFQIYWQSEVDGFARVFFKPSEKQSYKDQAQLNAFLDPAVSRFKQRELNEREEFKSTLVSFCRLYSFISQIARLQDIDLHKLDAFGRFLIKKISGRDNYYNLNLDNDVDLEYYRLEKTGSQDIILEAGIEIPLKGVKNAGTGDVPAEEKDVLSKIITRLNERFGTNFCWYFSYSCFAFSSACSADTLPL